MYYDPLLAKVIAHAPTREQAARLLARALAGELVVDPVSWLTQPGPWDIPTVADRVADHIERSWGRPVLVCGHSTGGAIALQLAVRRPAAVLGLVLVDTGAHMRGHGDVSAILDRIQRDWGDDLRAAVLDRSFQCPLSPEVRAGYLEWAAALDPRAVYGVLASQRDLDLTADLAAVRQPAAVVHGRHDRARPPQQGADGRPHVKRIRFERVCRRHYMGKHIVIDSDQRGNPSAEHGVIVDRQNPNHEFVPVFLVNGIFVSKRERRAPEDTA